MRKIEYIYETFIIKHMGHYTHNYINYNKSTHIKIIYILKYLLHAKNYNL